MDKPPHAPDDLVERLNALLEDADDLSSRIKDLKREGREGELRVIAKHIEEVLQIIREPIQNN